MAATRKLQGEIDRCLKKVAEGVETFEDIWKKVHNATNSNQKVNSNQKEKYEADLKKEIKKLQRLRDQIKSWIASAEIKDKSALLENRRLIETQMERFKIVERETKTKAYSKEGLGAAQKMDPAQRIKDEARHWLTNAISSLQIQIDQYESETESLLAGKKKRLDRDKQDRMDELRGKLDRHKYHVTKLETLLRLLDNDGVEAEQVNKIKDDVEYYIESSQEPDFQENDFIYDDIIGLDEVELSGTGVSLGIPSSATTDSNNSNETSGSPSSITSGGSPVPSPALTTPASAQLQLQQQQPLKPTAVRAANKSLTGSTTDVPVSKIISSTPSKNHQQQQQHQHQQPPTAAAVLSSSLIGSTNTQNPVAAAPTLAAAVAASTGAAPGQQHAPTSNLNATAVATAAAAAAAVANTQAVASAASTTTNNIQGQSVIQATPTIAFAAVAKNNASHLDNGTVAHPATSYALAAPTAASIVGSSAAQQQQLQLSNLQTNSSHLQNASSHSNTSNATTAASNIANVVVQQQQGVVNSNNLVNCISPSALNGLAMTAQQQQQQQQQQVMGVTNNVTCPSPSLHSPKHLNGLTLAANAAVVDAISLKTMAQEAINRQSVLDASPMNQVAVSAANLESRQQQQLLQHQHFATDTSVTQQQQQQQQAQQATQLGNSISVPTAATNGPTSVTSSSIGSSLTSLTNSSAASSSGASSAASTTSSGSNKQQLPTNVAHIPPLLGVAPLGPSPLHKDHQLQFQMMEAAYYHLPTPADSEKLGTYFHRTPVQTPPHYPQSQLPIYDTVEFYQRLSTETLFFVFYYMEGSKAQYLAAKALKKQSWRFHTKYMMWFQRHEEPKIINDDYEQGTYIYFDYEKWSQRKKEGFTFEYKYLEDKELN